MAEGYSELLEWVKSKTGNYIKVTSFSTSFQDGVAFLELYHTLCEDDFKKRAGSMEDVLGLSPEEKLKVLLGTCSECRLHDSVVPLLPSSLEHTSPIHPRRLAHLCMQLAFDMIEEGPLSVKQMLTIKDLVTPPFLDWNVYLIGCQEEDRLDKDHKDQLMTYVSAIRAAHQKWWPQYQQELQVCED